MRNKKINSHLKMLVSQLNQGGYHDGDSLGKQLGISRAAICKLIAKLKNYNVAMDAIKNKGYKILEPFILLEEEKIKKNLKSSPAIEIFESLPSTNDYLKAYRGATHPRICLAECQTKGKGRFQRNWHSPFAQNIYFSCLYYLEKDIGELAGLSLVVSLAIIKLLKQYGVADVYIKWPNDIICQGGKLSGSLIEVEAESYGICRVIIGIGINVNMLHAPLDIITQEWTSLRTLTQQYFDRNEICADLINILFSYLQQFDETGLKSFLSEWKAVDLLIDKTISLKCGNQLFTGRAAGINEMGHLLLEMPEGTRKTFSSGDTTILKSREQAI